MRSALALLAALFLGGCTSVWESTFVPARDATPPPLAASQTVRVREVNWDRLQNALREMESTAASRDTPFEEWPDEQKAEMKASMLRTLQVSTDPAAVDIIGRSDFRTTQTYRLETTDQPDLVSFARSIGATEVVWSRGYLGKAQTIVREPINTWSYGSNAAWDRRRGRWRSYPYSESSTTFVPVSVEADQFAYIAYFLAAGR